MNENKSSEAREWFVRLIRSPIVRRTAIFAAPFALGVLFAGVPTMSGATSASWMQAIGSVAAIGVAIWISDKQHRQNIDLVTREQQRLARERIREAAEVRQFLDAELREARDALLALSKASKPGSVLQHFLNSCVTSGGAANRHCEGMKKPLSLTPRGAFAIDRLLAITTEMRNLNTWAPSHPVDEACSWAERKLAEFDRALSLIGPSAADGTETP